MMLLALLIALAVVWLGGVVVVVSVCRSAGRGDRELEVRTRRVAPAAGRARLRLIA